METTATYFQRIFRALKNFGFLLEADPKLPSVATLITGAPLRGSWWSHPQAQVIFQVNERLEDHKDVLIMKLISGKVTFVHRKVWSQVFAIGTAREPLQLKKLSAEAEALLKQIDESGSLTTADVLKSLKWTMKIGDVARELEKRLLVVGRQFHSASGAHEKRFETWEHWAQRVKFVPAPVSVAMAKTNLEDRLQALNLEFNATAKFPWQ